MFLLPFFAFGLLFYFLRQPAAAQVSKPFVFLTWRAHSYAPAEFPGKVLGTSQSKISAGVEIISGGKTLDLSKTMIRWYGNGDLLASNTGLRQITFYIPETRGTIDLRVEVDDLKYGTLIKTVEIPVVAPEVVIETPFTAETFDTNQIILTAKPYFFNSISELVFNWKVNDQSPEENDNSGVLQINLNPGTPPGFRIITELSVNNPNNILESATKILSLVFNP